MFGQETEGKEQSIGERAWANDLQNELLRRSLVARLFFIKYKVLFSSRKKNVNHISLLLDLAYHVSALHRDLAKSWQMLNTTSLYFLNHFLMFN